MIIAGVVIDVVPESASQTALQLQATPGLVQVEGPVAPGRLVAVLEAADEQAMDTLVRDLHGRTGVLNVNPSYIHFDA